ncbi:FabD/lysophospholipase-like protein [Ceratobasidium sp. AG-I]|nr:FabD/lysophospholipase-like protein [Ceratobasidium sp. AG-I]
MSSKNGLRLMELDGGGINVLSALIIIWELMLRIQAIRNSLEVPRPCEIFDLIGGTGTGGLVAILLGRLKLTIEEAIDSYVEILRLGFVKKRFGLDEVFSATALEKAMGNIVARRCGRADARMIDSENRKNQCKVIVCAMPADAMRGGIPSCIRTYRVAANQGPDCTIVEAVRATMATPGMFKRAWIEEQSVKIGYLGGGLGCNNMTTRMLDEAELVFPGRPLATVLSVGSGQLRSASVPERKKYQQLLPSKLLATLESFAMDCEKTNQELSRRFGHTTNTYFRFNAEQGMQDICQSDVARLPEVQAHTRSYLQHTVVDSKIRDAAAAIIAGTESVQIVQGNIQPIKPPRLRIGRCPPPSRDFVGREDILETIRLFFFENPPPEQRIFVLHGLGGAGKTQLGLKFAQLYKEVFWDVFYIDSTTPDTISSSLVDMLKAAQVAVTPDDALNWLASQEHRWLMVFNNADDPHLNLHKYFPMCTHGNIIITTRNQHMIAHTRGPGSYYRVSEMSPEDALKLLLRISGIEHNEDTLSLGKILVEQLGFFALAVVQAAAYMRVMQSGVAGYLELLQSSREQLLRQVRVNQTGDYGLSLYASWEISYVKLKPRAAQLLHILSFMHHEGIPETFFEIASGRPASYAITLPLSDSQTATQTAIFDFLNLFRTPSGNWNPLALRDLTEHLSSFSLLYYNPDSRTYSMHPLVHEWCRTMSLDATTARESAAWLLALCVFNKYDSQSQALRRQLLPHLLALDTDQYQFVPELAASLSLVYLESGHGKEYEALARIALQASRKMLGNEHLLTVTLMHNLAVSFHTQDKSEEAEALVTEVIEFRKRVLGQEHHDTLTSMSILALSYSNQRRWEESEALFLEVIEGRKRVVGEEHIDTLSSMAMLATSYLLQGRLSEAEALGVEVFEAIRRVLGRGHPYTLTSMHNLAATYVKQGRLREAESLLEEVFALSKQELGKAHASTKRSLEVFEHVQKRIQLELENGGVS